MKGIGVIQLTLCLHLVQIYVNLSHLHKSRYCDIIPLHNPLTKVAIYHSDLEDACGTNQIETQN